MKGRCNDHASARLAQEHLPGDLARIRNCVADAPRQQQSVAAQDRHKALLRVSHSAANRYFVVQA